MDETPSKQQGSGRLGPLVARYGRRTLVIFAVILAVGLALRMERVVNPNAVPGDDALAYNALATSLYEHGTYGEPDFNNPTDWSPGAPLLYAGLFVVTGGPRDGSIRLLEALIGVLGIVAVFLLTFRIAGRAEALLAAGAVAIYPPFIHSTGAALSEPPAILYLPLAILALLWAMERRSTWAWIPAGLLLGLTALTRPEYLTVAVLIAVAVAIALWRRDGFRQAITPAVVLCLAIAVPIVPWAIRNTLELDRVVPISTGSGKALYVGTYLPADGDYQRVKADLLRRFTGRELAPDSEALNAVNPTPLFDRVAARYPDLPRDTALGKIGKQQLNDYISDDPIGYAAMTVRKGWRIWSSGVGDALESGPGRVIQILLVVLGLIGLVVLATRRRFFEAIIFAIPILSITAVGMVTLASNRRSEILMTLILPLAAVALMQGWRRIRPGTGDAPILQPQP